MDNELTQPYIQVPDVPSDFNPSGGKLEFAQALFNLLKQATVQGIVATGPQPYDVGQLQAQIAALQNTVKGLSKYRRVVALDAVPNGTVVVPFDDTSGGVAGAGTDYVVDVEFIGPNTNPNDYTWLLIAGSQTSTQVTIRIDASVSTHATMLVSIDQI